MRKRELKISIREIKKLEIVLRKIIITRIPGYYTSVFKGKGLEFEGYREYTEQDDASMIDWKATMRSDKILIKKFIEERDIKFFFLIDVSSSMVFGSTEKLKNEYAAEVILSLAHLILKSNDRLGFAFFTDKIKKIFPCSKGEKQFYVLMKELINPDNYGGGFDLRKTLDYLANSLDKTISLVIIISDFIGLKEGWKRKFEIFSRKFETIGLMIRDPIDKSIPSDLKIKQIFIQDPYSDKSLLIDPDLIKEKYREYASEKEKEIKNIFRKTGSDLLELETNKSFVWPLINLFKRRAMKWR